jgi:hypothetical protein
VSPILVRPVREQLEHDRVIRLLQVKLKRKHDVTANIGEDQSVSVKIGQMQIFPDLVLTSTDRARKLMGTVEVETSESVNHLEARAQWAHLGRARAPFHLYVPAGSVDIARRLAAENHVNVAEMWTYHTIGDQTHFKLAQRVPSSEPRVDVRGERPAAPPGKTPSRAEPGGEARQRRPASAPAQGAAKKRPTAAAPRAAKKRPAAPVRRSTAASRGKAPARKAAPAAQKRK